MESASVGAEERGEQLRSQRPDPMSCRIPPRQTEVLFVQKLPAAVGDPLAASGAEVPEGLMGAPSFGAPREAHQRQEQKQKIGTRKALPSQPPTSAINKSLESFTRRESTLLFRRQNQDLGDRPRRTQRQGFTTPQICHKLLAVKSHFDEL